MLDCVCNPVLVGGDNERHALGGQKQPNRLQCLNYGLGQAAIKVIDEDNCAGNVLEPIGSQQ